MFNYVCLGTNDLERGIRIYDAALAALGLARCNVSAEAGWDGWAGWGTYERGGVDEIALWLCRPFDQRPASSGNGTMVALTAPSWPAVDEFHRAALRSGGTCEGPPGLRTQYNPDFYAAYVRDPDGNKLAAVCRGHRIRPPEP